MIQGVLDLFGAWLPTASPLPPASRASRVTPTTPAPDSPAQTPPQRRIRLRDQEVSYTLTRVKRRSIGMLVAAEGLEVRAPRWVSLHEIESALLEKADWIVRKLEETQQRHAQLQQARIDWRDGCTVPYLGQPLRVSVTVQPERKRASAWLQQMTSCTQTIESDKEVGEPSEAAVLCVELPATIHSVADARDEMDEPLQAVSQHAIQDTVQTWMKQQARAHFQARLDHFAPLLGVQWHTLALSSAHTRWGSAGRTRDGTAAIRLNWRLMQHRLEVIDYVVVHELSHLRVMDHSPRFWATVASVMPDYADWRRLLRDQPLPPWS